MIQNANKKREQIQMFCMDEMVNKGPHFTFRVIVPMKINRGMRHTCCHIPNVKVEQREV